MAATLRSFCPNQAIAARTSRTGTQRNAAFCRYTGVPSALCWAEPIAMVDQVMTIGVSNWTTETPRLPRPPLMPVALPFFTLGKKKPILASEEAKFAPPIPQRAAMATITPYGVVGSWTAMPSQISGTISTTVDRAVKRRWPTIGPRKV